MKKLIFMLFVMCTAHSFAGQEVSEIATEIETVEDDSTKTTKCYDKGDILLWTGGSLFTMGIADAILSSRIMGFTMMGTGGVLMVTGGTIKIVNSIKKKNGNR